MSCTFSVRIDGHVATIRIERAAKLNAITPQMQAELLTIVRDLNRDDTCRVVVLTGGPKAFCAGSDIKELDHYPTPWSYRVREDDYTRSIRSLRKPVIAMIRGYCLGGGLEMALQSDLRYADTTAVLGAPEVTWGWIGGGGASQLLPRLVGYGQAARLLLSGRPLDAMQAMRIGLVDEVFPPEELEGQTMELARAIAGNAPLATQVIKQALRMSLNLGVEDGMHYENELVHLTYTTEDRHEGIRAFAERRRPEFKGR